MSVEQLQNQVSSLQSSVAELQRKVAALETKPNGNWLPSVLGRFRNDPDFDDAMTAAKQFRDTGGFPGDTVLSAESP